MSVLIALLHKKLDGVGMYRTVTLALLFLAATSIGLGTLGILDYGPLELSASLAFIVIIAVGVNILCSRLLKIAANHESAVITGLILFFLFLPPQSGEEWFWVGVATVVAILSKFVLTWRKQHVLNAAALGAVVVTWPYFTEASWWIATPVLFVPLALAGLVVVTKIRRWELVLSFIVVALGVFIFEEWRFGNTPVAATITFFVSWPALFLAFFMLTEPFTMPGTKQKQVVYGALVGFLSSTAIFTPYFAMTPELALVVGNLIMFPFTMRQKLFLTLQSKREIASQTWEFVFSKPADMVFRAGQYLEWMLPHQRADNRGPRRYFTIASAPEETVLRLALRVETKQGSTYKKTLMQMQPGEQIIASQRAGDFTLPAQTDTKLAFVAGGIGVTPFSSHLAHMQQTNRWHDTVLYYCNNTAADIAYLDTFSRYATGNLFRLVNVIGREKVADYEQGYLTEEIIKRHTPDYLERIWYLSGPPGMVNAYFTLLRTMQVPKKHIHRDFFPGLA